MSSYETGKKVPGLVTLATIARGLKVTIDRLYYGDENNAFITMAGDDGRKIVNAVYLLWEKRILYYDNNTPMSYVMSIVVNNNNTGERVLLFSYSSQILRLLSNLQDYSMNKDTFPDPEAYLEQLLSSAANDINKAMQN